MRALFRLASCSSYTFVTSYTVRSSYDMASSLMMETTMRYVFSPASKITVLPSVMASFGLTEAKSYEAPSKTSVPTAVMVLPPFFTSITSAVEMSVVMVSFNMSVS